MRVLQFNSFDKGPIEFSMIRVNSNCKRLASSARPSRRCRANVRRRMWPQGAGGGGDGAGAGNLQPGACEPKYNSGGMGSRRL